MPFPGALGEQRRAQWGRNIAPSRTAWTVARGSSHEVCLGDVRGSLGPRKDWIGPTDCSRERGSTMPRPSPLSQSSETPVVAPARSDAKQMNEYHQTLMKLRLEGGLDGIELGPVLGQGSFGRVYKGARHDLHPDTVAESSMTLHLIVNLP